MNSPCIHGLLPQQCASCRTCEHGQTASACLRCRTVLASRKTPAPVGVEPSQQHGGHEIFFEAAASGWRYRATDAAPSRESYRSAFLARKAVDQLSAVAVENPAKGAKRGRSDS